MIDREVCFCRQCELICLNSFVWTHLSELICLNSFVWTHLSEFICLYRSLITDLLATLQCIRILYGYNMVLTQCKLQYLYTIMYTYQCPYCYVYWKPSVHVWCCLVCTYIHMYIRTCVRMHCTVHTLLCMTVVVWPLTFAGGLWRTLLVHLCQEGALHCGLPYVWEESDSHIKETEVSMGVS